jgi:hypothetical protein
MFFKFSKCYHLVNVIRFVLAKSGHIKWQACTVQQKCYNLKQNTLFFSEYITKTFQLNYIYLLQFKA